MESLENLKNPETVGLMESPENLKILHLPYIMIKKLFFALSLYCALPSSAQSVFVKAAGGLGSQWGASGCVGMAKIAIGYEAELSQTLAIAPSIGFTTRGWQAADVQTPDLLFDDEGNRLDADGNITTNPAEQAQRYATDAEGNPIAPLYSMMHRTYTTNYLQLDIPLNCYFRLGERRYIVATAGVWGAVGVAGRRKTEGDGTAAGGRKVSYTDKVFDLDGVHRFDVGLKAGVGYQFPSSLTLSIEGEFGLLPTNRQGVCPEGMKPETFLASDPFAGKSSRSFAVGITLSYRLNKRAQ